jgi:hypothetical protein
MKTKKHFILSLILMGTSASASTKGIVPYDYYLDCTNFNYSLEIVEHITPRNDGSSNSDTVITRTTLKKGDPKDVFRHVVDSQDFTQLKEGYTQNQSEWTFEGSQFKLLLRYNVDTMPGAETQKSSGVYPGFLTAKTRFRNFKRVLFICVDDNHL